MSNQDETFELEGRVDDFIQELAATEPQEQDDPPEIQDTASENEDNIQPDLNMSTSTTSNDSDLKNIFGNDSALSDTELAISLTSNKKEDRAGMDPKTLQRTRDTATRTLSKTFKVQTALGTSGVVGEENPDLETSEIAVVFSENTHVADMLGRVIKDYDITSAIEMRLVVNQDEVHPSKKYGDKTFDLLKDIGAIDIDQVKEYSGDIMLYDKKDGVHRQNQDWLLRLVQNNISSSISALIEPTFEALEPKYRNGSVYLKLALDLIFMIDDNVIEALQAYIKRFGKNGLLSFEGENVNTAAIEIVGLSRRLNQLNELPNDAAKDVLKGLQKVTHNHEFKKSFEMIFNFENQKCIALTATPDKSTTFENIIRYFTEAQTQYTSMVLRGQWAGKKPAKHAHHGLGGADGDRPCWNCGITGHGARECKKPFDSATFERNKKAFYETKKKNGGDRGGGGGYRGAPKGNDRSKFGGSGGASANGVIVTSSGQVFTNCKHGTSADGCGQNQTHSSKYHAQWKSNKNSFKLPGSHPFMVALAKGDQCLPCDNDKKPSGNFQEAVAQALQQFKAEQLQRLSTLETQSADSDVSNTAGLLKSLFQ